MTDEQMIEYMTSVAENTGASLEQDGPTDKTFASFIFSKDGEVIDVTAIKVDGKAYLCDIEATFLPREIYYDQTSDDHPEPRDLEIKQNLEALLNKEVKFHAKSSIFNPKKGYILLKVDGKLEKIPIKKTNALLK